MGNNPLGDPSTWMNRSHCSACNQRIDKNIAHDCLMTKALQRTARTMDVCGMKTNHERYEPYDRMVPRREGFATDGIEHLWPRPKPRTARDREADEFRLKFYLADHMAAAESRRLTWMMYGDSSPYEFKTRATIHWDDGTEIHETTLKTVRPGPEPDDEDRHGRIETVQPDPARPSGDDADGQRQAVEGAPGVRPGTDRVERPGHERTWAGGHWSC